MFVSKFKCVVFLFILSFSYIICFASNNEKIIKIAILDNFHFQPNITNEYSKYYLQGINLARHSALRQGFKLQFKIFTYSKDPLAILSVIPDVKRWNPDVILGPRNSNMFITIKNSFKDILVLSPFATSSGVEKMPKNYYSLSLPDRYIAKAIFVFTKRHYPNSRVFSIVEADCKNCVDLSRELGDLYAKSHNKITEKFFLQKSVKDVKIKKLLEGYESQNIILLPNTSYASAILMVRITNYLKKPMLFIGGDDWGSWRNTEVGKLKADFPYNGIHPTPWSFDVNTRLKNDFYKRYKDYYHSSPVDPAIFLSYTAVISVIDSLIKYDDIRVKNMKAKILSSYMTALKHNPNWYRPSEYVFYETNNNKTYPIDNVSLY